MLFLLTSVLLFVHALAQDADCDFRQFVQTNRIYEIYNPNYPYSYQRGRVCRWIGESPSGYQSRIDCLLEMPLGDSGYKNCFQTPGCTGDRVLISRTGDPQLNNAQAYCGQQTLTGFLSVNTVITVALITTNSTTGGRFRCNLTAQAVPQPPCSCGVHRTNRIVGGTQTGAHEYPMMTGIIERSIGRILCGGVILTPKYILSAAHCLIGLTPADIIISVGDRNLFQGLMFNVSSFTIHPNFNPDNLDYDVATLKVTGTIPMNENIGPVCLPFYLQNANLTGATVTLLGWGTTSFGGPTSSILLKTDVTVISQAQCMRSQPVTSRQVCTYTARKDSCQNDSGGPGLYTGPTGRLFGVGIVSSGVGCASNSPSINTRVTSSEILTWIVNNAPGDHCNAQ